MKYDHRFGPLIAFLGFRVFGAPVSSVSSRARLRPPPPPTCFFDVFDFIARFIDFFVDRAMVAN